MKKLKFTLLVGICALAFNVSAQEVGVNITENNAYTGLYHVKLYVLDVVTQNYCLVGDKKNISLSGAYFSSSQIDLSCVNLVSDQKDRYRYVVVIVRQEASGSGQNWTPLLDTGEMWGQFYIYVTLN